MLLSFFEMLAYGKSSYGQWAQCLSRRAGISVSKQAIFSRMNTAWVELTKKLVETVLNQKISTRPWSPLFTTFTRVLLQDSTCLALPDCLYRVYKGPTSKGMKKATAKLNLVMDVLTGQFVSLSCLPFTVTEQALSESILQIARAGDLVIRDLGYSAMKTFLQMDSRQIYFVSRLRYGLSLIDAETSKPIDLLQLLKGRSQASHWVRFTSNKALKVRLVAKKLADIHAEERKRKARKNRDKRLNHTQDYYKLLEYAIFITNITEETWSVEQVAEAYKIRWNIEIVFKSWKSGMNIKQVIPAEVVHTYRVESILYMLLLYILWFQKLIYMPARKYAGQAGFELSILKLITTRIATEPTDWLISTTKNPFLKQKWIFKCGYEKRGRPNTHLHLKQLFPNLT